MRKEEFYQDALSGSVGPLAGIRVLEATHNSAGPLVGTLLADLGAESIKIDQPNVGDMARRIPPFVESSSPLEASKLYLSINRNKKGITLNLKAEEGKRLFKELVKPVDIVIENYKPGTMEGWGLGYQDLKKIKPDIIYTSVSGYGQFGPNHNKPGYGAIGQALGGLMSVTGYPDGPPLRTGYNMGNGLAGWQGAIACLAALYYKRRTGKGQHIDISQQDSIVYCSAWGIMAAENVDHIWPREGNTVRILAPYNIYRGGDDNYVFIAVVLESHWGKLCKLMGREELINDAKTNSPTARAERGEFVDSIVEEWTMKHTVQEVVDMLDKEQIVVAPILDFERILADEHIKQREMVVEVEHPSANKIKLYGVANKYSLTPARIRMPAPMLGQHNEEVYKNFLGLGDHDLLRLTNEGII
jgi:crotonobetainyl-CoA:carnitine CoA-transferase CaiB-like acyl-CoA transferase